MSKFSIGEKGEAIYTEPRDAAFYRAEAVLSPEFEGDHVGLCLSVHGGGEAVTVGIKGEDDVQQFLYLAAVQAKLIAEGEPLILMKKITVDAEDAA